MNKKDKSEPYAEWRTPSALIVYNSEAVVKTISSERYPERLAASLEAKGIRTDITPGNVETGQLLLIRQYDIIIVSHALPTIDAFDLLSALRKLSYYKDSVLVLCTNKVTKAVKSLCDYKKVDAAYALSTPTNAVAEDILARYKQRREEIIKNRMQRLVDEAKAHGLLYDIESSRPSVRDDIKDIIRLLGFNMKLTGVEYLSFIIELRLLGADMPAAGFYEYAAVYFGTTGAAVEKAIRYSIEQAWTNGCISTQHYVFGNTTDASKGKPTNAEFIATLYEHLRIHMFGDMLVSIR